MFLIIVIYFTISFISLIFMLFLMFTAPEGYEDEKGFHLSSKSKKKK